MGPMMDASTADRYLKFIGISEREGANILMRGKPLPLNPPGCFVTPTLALFEKRTPEEIRKSVSLQTEILAPHLSVIGFQDEEELLSLLQPLTYGRSISLGQFRCTSRASGVTCRGHAGGFTISRSGISSQA